MDTTLFVGLSHQVAMRRRMDIIANNIANMGTTGFKREAVMFREYMRDIEGDLPASLKKVAFVQDYGISREMATGDLQTTGNTLDIAISGDGLFSVRRENGELAYTRNGHLAISNDNTLITSNGYELLDRGGNTISFPANIIGLKFADDGTISTKEGGIIASLNVLSFQNYGNMKKIGDSLYATNEVGVPSEDFTLVQGVVEASNVTPILEVTRMIEVSRAYSQTAKMLDRLQELETKSINRLARFG